MLDLTSSLFDIEHPCDVLPFMVSHSRTIPGILLGFVNSCLGDDFMERIESNTVPTYRVVPLSVRQRKRTAVTKRWPSIQIQWMPILIGFFLARALLLNELLPFGVAYLAATRRQSQEVSPGPFIGVLLGLFTLNAPVLLLPYYLIVGLIWFVGGTSKQRPHQFWILWIIVGFLLIKAPINLLYQRAAMVWIAALAESMLAIVGYSIVIPLLERTASHSLAHKELQLSLLLVAGLMGSDLIIAGISMRWVIMFYLILTTARLGGVLLTFMAGPSLLVVSLLLQMPIEFGTLLVVVGVMAGCFHKTPGGLWLGGIVGCLLVFHVPIQAQTVVCFGYIFVAGLLVYITPCKHVRKLERIIPGTDKYLERQASHNTRVQQILEKRIVQFSQVFTELASTLDNSSFVSQQLGTFAKIVDDLGRELNTDVEFAEAIEEKLWQRLDCYELSELTVLQGSDGHEICGQRLTPCGEGWCEQVARESEHLLGGRYQVVTRNCTEQDSCGFDIKPKPRYRLDVQTAKVAQGKVSGDSDIVFPLSAGKVGLLVSDGMGTGERAAADSLATIRLLEKLIRMGYDRELGVKIINQTLLTRNRDESFVTIDLVVVDTQNGQLEFVKIGAAPSFIKRGYDIEVIQNYALPVGILHHVDVEPERRLLKEGDFLVMVTDGVLESQRELTNKDEWLCSLLRRVDDDISCQELASSVLAQSLQTTKGEVQDDMMVLVTRLVKEDPEIYSYRGN